MAVNTKFLLTIAVASVIIAALQGCSKSGANNIQNMTPDQQKASFAADPSKEPQSVKDQLSAGMKSATVPTAQQGHPQQ